MSRRRESPPTLEELRREYDEARKDWPGPWPESVWRMPQPCTRECKALLRRWLAHLQLLAAGDGDYCGPLVTRRTTSTPEDAEAILLQLADSRCAGMTAERIEALRALRARAIPRSRKSAGWSTRPARPDG